MWGRIWNDPLALSCQVPLVTFGGTAGLAMGPPWVMEGSQACSLSCPTPWLSDPPCRVTKWTHRVAMCHEGRVGRIISRERNRATWHSPLLSQHSPPPTRGCCPSDSESRPRDLRHSYRLNVCVSPESTDRNPNLQRDGMRRWGLWKAIRS